jgi:hypothetical protein
MRKINKKHAMMEIKVFGGQRSSDELDPNQHHTAAGDDKQR